MLGHDIGGGSAAPLLDGATHRATSGTSVTSAATALIKAVVGTGIFALPPAIRACGMLLGLFMTLLMSAVSLYTTWAMVEAVRELRRKGHARENDGRIEYTDVTTLYSPRSEAVVTMGCVLGQFGSVLAFMTFISSSVAPLVRPWHVSDLHIYALIALIEAPLVLLRETSHPAFEAAMACGIGAVLLALGTVVWGAVVASDLGRPGGSAPAEAELVMVDTGGLGLMFGVGLIMFSCHLEAVSIEADMRRRESFDRVVVLAFAALTLLFAGFGALVYAGLGEATGRMRVPTGANASGDDAGEWQWQEATLMENLPNGGFVVAVKLLMALNLLATMPVTMLPASRALEQLAGVRSSWACAALRLALLAGLAGAAATLPGFETVVGITGALGGITCFSLPALCYAHFCKAAMGAPAAALAHAVAVFGLAGTVWSFVQQVL